MGAESRLICVNCGVSGGERRLPMKEEEGERWWMLEELFEIKVRGRVEEEDDSYW